MTCPSPDCGIGCFLHRNRRQEVRLPARDVQSGAMKSSARIVHFPNDALPEDICELSGGKILYDKALLCCG